jgi:3-phosphoshikimate 1-carboxyvinyltransferase
VAARPVLAWTAGPGRGVQGDIKVPGDKSISHRALMLGGIALGTTRVRGFLESEDCLATLSAMRAMGVQIDRGGPGEVTVHGAGLRGLHPPAGALDMGNAGTAMRLFTGLLAGQSFDTILVGDESLMKRPMERVAVPLRRMGAEVATADGRPPVRITGGRALHGIDYRMEVASAQVKSAVLLAGLYAEGRTSVAEPAVTRDHTERMLRGFGVPVASTMHHIAIDPREPRACSLEVPGDFSSAAFFLVAAAVAGRAPLTIRNVGVNPTRTGLLDILSLMGARIDLVNERLAGDEPVADLVAHPSRLRGIEVPEALVPLAIDEFPVLFVAAALASGETRVTGAAELRVKESDRIGVMAEGLATLGIEVAPTPDGMLVRGGRLRAGSVDSHGDHRIAMSFAVAAACADGPVHILDVANVATSFPGFVPIAREAGLELTEAEAGS